MRVEFCRAGRVLASADVEGTVLVPHLPFDLEAAVSEDSVRIEAPGERRFAGRLSLPVVAGDDLTFAEIDVPSSGIFDQQDLKQMWRVAAPLLRWEQREAQEAADQIGLAGGTQDLPVELIRSWPSLLACMREASALIAHWPTRFAQSAQWVPLGVAGGFEDLAATEMSLTDERVGPRGPTHSLRRIASEEDFQSRLISATTRKAAALVAASVPAEALQTSALLRSVLVMLEGVATRADAPGIADLDFSSLPPSFAAFFSACLRLLMSVRATGAPGDFLPLLDTDALYEAWVSEHCLASLTDRLGPPAGERSGSRIGSWTLDSGLLELHHKPLIRGMRPSRFGRTDFMSVVAERLIPDTMLVFTPADVQARTRLAVLDAKAWSTMTAEDALTQSAKYLHGVRLHNVADRSAVGVVEHVALVTCANPPSLRAPWLGQSSALRALPSLPSESLPLRLSFLLQLLGAA